MKIFLLHVSQTGNTDTAADYSVLHPGWTTMQNAVKPLVPLSRKWQFGCLVNEDVRYGNKETPVQL